MRRAVIAAAMLLPSIGNAAAVCSWDRPGHNPFMGDVVAAVDRYADIPAGTRAKLKARMQRRDYDDIAAIRRDSIEGRHQYAPDITGMHFGQGQVCATVTRDRWTAEMVERGLVYCEDGHCIIVPTVCRNVSRIRRLAATPPADSADGPININPSAGGWGLRALDGPAGVGLRLPELPVLPQAIAVSESPIVSLPISSDDVQGVVDGNLTPWADETIPIASQGPLLLPRVPQLPAPIPAVPEPATLTTLFSGFLVVLAAARRHSSP